MSHPFNYMLLFVIFSLICVSCAWKVSDFILKWYLSLARKNSVDINTAFLTFSVYCTICPIFIAIGATLFKKMVVWLGVL